MKNVVTLSVVFAFAILLMGCNSNKTPENEDTTNPTSDNQPSEEQQVEQKTISEGDIVKVDYVGATEDGEVFDTSIETVAKDEGLYNEQRPYEPLEFQVGAGQMIPGFENGILGMKVGETKTVTILPEDGYGEVREDLVQVVPLSNFVEADIEPVVGETYNFGIAQGKILAVTEDNVEIDFNHFLAGKTLEFTITVKDIVEGELGDQPTDRNTGIEAENMEE